MQTKYLAVACASLLLLGAGCVPTPKDLIEKVMDNKITEGLRGKESVKMNDDGSSSFTDDQTGEETTFGTGTTLPADFPSDLPIMDGATITSSAVTQEGAWVTFDISDSPDQVLSFYDDELSFGGWTKYGSASQGTSETAAYTYGDEWTNIVATDNEDGTTSVTLTRATQSQ